MKLDILLPCYKPHAGWEKNIIDAVANLQKEIGSLGELHLYITNDGASDEYYDEQVLKQISDAMEGRFHFLKYKL